MVINKKLRSGNEKVDLYIEQLEEELLRKSTSSIDKFIRSADKVANVMADDLNHIADGNPDLCRILTPDGSDKSVERIFLMLKNSELFSEIAKTAESLIPEIVNEAQDLKVELDPDGNAFEQMQKRIKEKKGK